MRYINEELKKANQKTPVTPQDVFGFAAGTSTGGLIAIMLGKLGMSLSECIDAYATLSKNIFGKKKHFRGTMTRGLATPKYSGSNLEKHILELMEKKSFTSPLPMFSRENRDKMGW